MEATVQIGQGDIVSVSGSNEQWKVCWIYNDGQAELLNRIGRSYPEAVHISQLELIKKREEQA
jgi:hypothetical protein